MWAYATMGREPGAGLMRGLEGRAEALEVANTLKGGDEEGKGGGSLISFDILH